MSFFSSADASSARSGPDKAFIRAMFNAISRRYDVLNRLMSWGMDKRWRKRALNALGPLKKAPLILDVATGTGDLALAAAARFPDAHMTALDLSEDMIAKAKLKGQKYPNIKWIQGDAEQLPFENHTFDVVMVAFGIRNFENINQGISELYRVLKPHKGKLLILEFSPLKKGLWALLFKMYFYGIVPFMGALVARNRAAYSYLPQSVGAFYAPRDVKHLLAKHRFRSIRTQSLSWGIVSLYLAQS